MKNPTDNLSPTAVSYATDSAYFGTRYKQGGRDVFALQLSPAEITALIKKPNPDAPNPGNRRIRLSHAKAFASYFIEQEGWVAPGIILRAPSIFTFTPDPNLPEVNGAQFGTVSFARRNQSDIQILDGQHRILGFFLADEIVTDELQRARSTQFAASRSEGKGSVAYIAAKGEVERLEKVRDRLNDERVSVEIQVTNEMSIYRQMFYDIADNALGITASVKARFDTRKVANRALPAVLDHPLLAGRVDLEADRIRTSQDSPYFITARHTVEIIRTTNLGFDGRFGRRLEETLSEGTVAQETIEFLDLLVECFPQLNAITIGSITPDTLRKTSLLGSPLFLRMLGGAWHDLREQHAFTKPMLKGFFEALSKHLSVPIHENSIWKTHVDPEAFNLGASAPNGRRGLATSLVESLVDWAITKPAFLDADPLPAPEKPEDPDAGIDFAPSHRTKKLAVEVDNEIADIKEQALKRAAQAAVEMENIEKEMESDPDLVDD